MSQRQSGGGHPSLRVRASKERESQGGGQPSLRVRASKERESQEGDNHL